jgi:3-oxoacyl-[acyl-carrier protein] reductase
MNHKIPNIGFFRVVNYLWRCYMRFLEKVAVVTGAGMGIGAATAIAFAEEGASVVALDKNDTALEELVSRMDNKGSALLPICADVTRSQDVAQAVRATLKQFGRIDILVNNAGGASPRGLLQFLESSEEEWDFVIDLSLKSVLILTHAVLGNMVERRSGRIINISSITGLGGSVGQVDYSAAKAGVLGFSRALAKEVGTYNITVNCVLPGATETPGLKNINFPSEAVEEMKRRTYLGRLGRPEDIVSMILFLASEEASYITGQSYAVCGARNLP